MKIVRCSKCGALIHISNECYLCGNTDGFDVVSNAAPIHENVITKYDKMLQSFERKDYATVINISSDILKWMPFDSEVFWLRLLAKNECSCDGELIIRGFNCDDSADFYNAIQYADANQKQVYNNVCDKIKLISEKLKAVITEFTLTEKRKLNIEDVQSKMSEEFNSRQNKLFELWTELNNVEQSIVNIESDSTILLREQKDSLKKALDGANSIKQLFYNKKECTKEEFDKYSMQLESSAILSGKSLEQIKNNKANHQWIKDYNKQVALRDETLAKLLKEIDSLKTYEAKLAQLVSKVETLDLQEQKALKYANTYNFKGIRSIIGETNFTSVLKNSGIAFVEVKNI